MERKEKEERPRCLCHSDWRQRQEMRRQTFWPHPSDEKSPRGNFPQLCAEKVHARALGSICIGVGAIDAAMQAAAPPSWRTHSLTHTQSKDHRGQISPVDGHETRAGMDVRGRRREARKGSVTRRMLNISSHLEFPFSPHRMLPECLREHWRGVAGVQ